MRDKLLQVFNAFLMCPKHLLRVILLLCFCNALLGQVAIRTSLSEFRDVDNPLVNPSLANETDTLRLSLETRSYFGPVRVLRSNWLGVDHVFGRSHGRYHRIGAYVVNQNEGEYVQRNRGYISYAFSVKTGEEVGLNVGCAVGGVQYLFRSSVASVGGSDITPDGSIGVSGWYKKIKLGLAWHQINAGTIQPIGFSYTLLSYYAFTGSYSRELNDDLTLGLNGSLRWKSDFADAHVGGNLNWRDQVNVLYNFVLNSRHVLGAGVNLLNIGPKKLGLRFSVGIAQQKHTTIDAPSYQLGIIMN